MKTLNKICYLKLKKKQNVKNFFINYDPKHAAMHGVLRLIFELLFGENTLKAVSFGFQELAPITFDGLYLFNCDLLFILTNLFFIFFYSIFCIITFDNKKINNFDFFNFFINWCYIPLFFPWFVLLLSLDLDDQTHSTKIEIIADMNLDSQLDPIVKKQNLFPVSESIKQMNFTNQRYNSLLNDIKKLKQDELMAKEFYSKEYFDFCDKYGYEKKKISSVGIFNIISYEQKLFWVDSKFFKSTYKISELSYNPTELENYKPLLLKQNKKFAITYDKAFEDRMTISSIIALADRKGYIIKENPLLRETFRTIVKKSDFYEYPYVYNHDNSPFYYEQIYYKPDLIFQSTYFYDKVLSNDKK